jgi:hypothetical protein
MLFTGFQVLFLYYVETKFVETFTHEKKITQRLNHPTGHNIAYIMVVTDLKDTLLVKYSSTSKIYASIFDAKLVISPGNDVVSENDVPFNEYKFVQPTTIKMQSSIAPGGIIGAATSKKINYKLAFPESIFDAKAK